MCFWVNAPSFRESLSRCRRIYLSLLQVTPDTSFLAAHSTSFDAKRAIRIKSQMALASQSTGARLLLPKASTP